MGLSAGKVHTFSGRMKKPRVFTTRLLSGGGGQGGLMGHGLSQTLGGSVLDGRSICDRDAGARALLWLFGLSQLRADC